MNNKKYPEEIKQWRKAVKDLILFCKEKNISIDGEFTLFSGNDDDFKIEFRSVDASGIVFSGVDAILPIEEFEDNE